MGVAAVAGGVLYLTLLLTVFLRARKLFIASLLLLFQFTWNLLSVAYIEANEGMLLVSTWSVTVYAVLSVHPPRRGGAWWSRRRIPAACGGRACARCVRP